MRKTLQILFVLSALLSISALVVSTSYAQNAGAIWTTRSGCGTPDQDVNQFDTGGMVYINGSGFVAGTYSWTIVGQPGGASGDPGTQVAGGDVTVDETGNFCFAAYTIPADDWGEYNVTLASSKGDNYRVNQLPTPTPIETTVANTPTSTMIPTESPVLQPTVAPTNTLVPTNTSVPTNTLVPTQTIAPIMTGTAGSTPVPQKAPVTGGASSPVLLQAGSLLMALISVGSFILLKKKID